MYQLFKQTVWLAIHLILSSFPSSVYLILIPNSFQNELLELVHELNRDDQVDGLLVQLPLPDHISEKLVCQSVDPHKDVDGFHMFNIGEFTSSIYLPIYYIYQFVHLCTGLVCYIHVCILETYYIMFVLVNYTIMYLNYMSTVTTITN